MSETHGLDNVLHFHRQQCNDPECDADAEAFSELTQLRDDNARLTTENASLLESFKSEYERAEKISRHEIWYNAEIERLHAALDSQFTTLTPRNCETCKHATEAMRGRVVEMGENLQRYFSTHGGKLDQAASIALGDFVKIIKDEPLPSFGAEQCADCEPLKPEA